MMGYLEEIFKRCEDEINVDNIRDFDSFDNEMSKLKNSQKTIHLREKIFNIDLVQDIAFSNIKEEIGITEPEDLDKIEIPVGIKNEQQLKMQLGAKRERGVQAAIKAQDIALAERIRDEPLTDYEKATAILGRKPLVEEVIGLREEGRL